jgi:hypothetical protein
MSHAITTASAVPPTQWIYTLEWYDHLAWWLHDAAPKGPPGPTRRDHLLLWSVWIPVLTALVVCLSVAAVGLFQVRNHQLWVLCLLAAILCLMLIWAAAQARPVRLLRHDMTKQNTEVTLRLRAKQLEEAGDVINPDRIHWLLVDNDQFTVASELWRMTGRGVERYEYREVSCRWELLHDVIVTDAHLFLIHTGDEPWIIPRRAFPDAAAVDRFVAQVQAYREAAAKAAPPVPPDGICLSPAAQSPPSPITGGPR